MLGEVECSRGAYSVDLSGRGLRGELDQRVGLLGSLEALSLADNDLRGTLTEANELVFTFENG